jgi:hypothetical protein
MQPADRDRLGDLGEAQPHRDTDATPLEHEPLAAAERQQPVDGVAVGIVVDLVEQPLLGRLRSSA